MGAQRHRHGRRSKNCTPENGIITPLEMYTT